MPTVKQLQVTFDCSEPELVARFWCEVLGYVVPPVPEEFATWDDFRHSLPPEEQGPWFACVDPSGVGPRRFFQRVPEDSCIVMQDIEGSAVPEHLRAWWTQDQGWCLHSATWWRRHWEQSGIVDIEVADTMPDGWRRWLDWHLAIAAHNREEIEALARR